ncbi:MAG TPA: tetratricopeptide repeat protein [Candidatus Melainabacteria bacterium]|nr:tetratricopeptide repeat protein [Candidatus Melainabacteria bacterium]
MIDTAGKIGWLFALIVSGGWQDLDAGARAAMREGRLAEAESQWKEAIARAESDKEINPGVVDCLIGLAWLYDKRGDTAESERLYELAMRTVEGVKGGDSAAYADRLPDLAALYRRHGKSWHSDLLFQRLIKIRENTSGKNSTEVATALEMYSRFLQSEGRQAEATKTAEKAHTIRDSLTDAQPQQ